MSFLLNQCTFVPFTAELLESAEEFNCGHSDLNDFFKNDCINYSSELLGKSYCFILDKDPRQIVCAFTVSNDSVKTFDLPNNRKKTIIKEIPRPKQMRNYPAVLIGRLGVSKNFKGQGVGIELMNFIKAWFVDGANKTGCRFIVVDSYNESGPLSYYDKNGFKPIFSTIDQEKIYFDIPKEQNLKTRLMYFDLILLSK
jgi:GNAT superfamily N-acetyltransferase